MEQEIFKTFIRFLKDNDLWHQFNAVTKSYGILFSENINKDRLLKLTKNVPYELIYWALPNITYDFQGREMTIEDKFIQLKWFHKLLNIPFVSVNFSTDLIRNIKYEIRYALSGLESSDIEPYIKNDQDLEILDYFFK